MNLQQMMMSTLTSPVPAGAWEAAQGPLFMVNVWTPRGHRAPFVESNQMRRAPSEAPEESVLRLFPSMEHAEAYRKGIHLLQSEIVQVTLEEAFMRGAEAEGPFRAGGMGPIRIDLSLMLSNGYPRTVDVLFTAMATRH